MDELWNERQDFRLDVHFAPTEMSPYIKTHDRYTYRELESIFDETDVLIAPSVWYETFGYTVLEALSYGVPVIISGTVGAKDILVEGAGIVVEDISPARLCDALRQLTPDMIRQMNTTIIERQVIMELRDMTRQIEQYCYGW